MKKNRSNFTGRRHAARIRSPWLRRAFRNAKVRDLEAAAEVIVTLMRRKEQLFPHDHRAILSWEVSELGNQFHVSVASLADVSG
jgi:hypothetical protein